ncbi:MAG: hypothetical protein FJ301_10250 [Planctomycetes bacterium]|nr:hypothetical protein [Planctomycetota bacterium]
MTRRRQSPAPTALSLAPVLVALLWIAGIARFRSYELSTNQWAAVLASAFALHLLQKRALRPKSLPPLPASANPAILALLAAVVVGLLGSVLGGAVEAMLPPGAPGAPDGTPWPLRTLWHGACCFAASYCAFLGRLWGAIGHAPAKPGDPSA